MSFYIPSLLVLLIKIEPSENPGSPKTFLEIFLNGGDFVQALCYEDVLRTYFDWEGLEIWSISEEETQELINQHDVLLCDL